MVLKRRGPRGYQVLIDGRPTDGVVIGKDLRAVKCTRQVAEPIGDVRWGSVSWEGRIADGVLGVGENTVGVELSRSERVTEAEDIVWTTSSGLEAHRTSHGNWEQDSQSSECASNHLDVGVKEDYLLSATESISTSFIPENPKPNTEEI